jgi:hypothetical protein
VSCFPFMELTLGGQALGLESPLPKRKDSCVQGGPLNLGIVNIWDRMIICCGDCRRHCKMSRDAGGIPSPIVTLPRAPGSRKVLVESLASAGVGANIEWSPWGLRMSPTYVAFGEWLVRWFECLRKAQVMETWSQMQ